MVRGYHQAAATLNLLRAFTKGASPISAARTSGTWSSSPAAAKASANDELAQEIERALRFMARAA